MLCNAPVLDCFHVVQRALYERGDGAEKFFSSLESQSFSGGQKWETLEHRGAIKIHAGDKFSQLQANMNNLAQLSYKGVPEYGLPKLILPITVHSGLKQPKSMEKFLQKKDNLYS